MKRLAILFEHPEWQKPLFSALERRDVPFDQYDLKSLAFDAGAPPEAALYFNQASPSAYLRGNPRAVPLALALMRALEVRGRRVLNGSRVFSLELSKSTQAAVITSLGLVTPRTHTFNDPAALEAVEDGIRFPALIKPDQGGSGARIFEVQSLSALRELVESTPGIWDPDNLLNVQEKIPADTARGIVRMEFLDGQLLYAMRVVSHGRYNLCPAPICNPEDPSAGACDLSSAMPPVEFYPYPEIPAEAVEQGLRIAAAVGLDVGGIEYLDGLDGQRYFFDINANSNLRPSIAQAFGFDPFDRVATFLRSQLAKSVAPSPGPRANATVLREGERHLELSVRRSAGDEL